MKHGFTKLLSSMLAATMLAGGIQTAVPVNVFAAAAFVDYGGWNETIYADISGISDSDVTAVSYSGPTSGSLTGNDLAYLVRDNDNGGVRVDIPGLKAGTYTLTVTTTSGTVSKDGIKVYAYDRSGYAHVDMAKEYSSDPGIGAYNNDGTLKSNAIVMYVTEENKNSVQVPGYEGSSYPAGIGNILNYKSQSENGVTGGGKTDVIKLLATKNIPLDIRFIGQISAGDINTRASGWGGTNIDGLTGYNSTENGGTTGDNGMVARVYYANYITFEGIGDDADIDGWGFQIISNTGYKCHGFEFRNLEFTSTPEDAIGFEGTSGSNSASQTKDYITAPIIGCWVHNNTFGQGYCAHPAESDKGEGDGSVDFKRGYGYTLSYNHFVENHKTNLIGSSDTSHQYDITFHHNYYQAVWARQPLARQANMHIYNSYFLNGSDTSFIMSLRANCYIFSEANFFDACKNPIQDKGSGGVAKSYNDIFAGTSGDEDSEHVSSRTTAISKSTTNKYAAEMNNATMYSGYDAFDPAKNGSLTSAVQAKADCIAKAGAMPEPSAIEMEPTPESIITTKPSNAVTLPFELNFADTSSSNYWAKQTSAASLASGTQVEIANALVTPAAKITNTATTMKVRDNGVIFTVASGATLTISQSGSGSYGLAVYNEYGEPVLEAAVGATASAAIPAGTYVLKSKNVEKDSYLAYIKIAANGSVTESSTESTTKVTESSTETTTQETTEPYKVNVGSSSAAAGESVAIPVTISNNDIDGFLAEVKYDDNTLKFVSVTSDGFMVQGRAADGNITVVGVSNYTDTDELFTLYFTAIGAGTAAVSVTFDEMYILSDDDETEDDNLTPTVTNGSTTVSNSFGDVNGNGIIEEEDAAVVLRYLAGISTFERANLSISAEQAEANADCDGISGIDMRDVIWILNH